MKGDHKRSKRSSLTLPHVKRDDDSKENFPEKEDIPLSNVDKLPDIKTSNGTNGNNSAEKLKNNDREAHEHSATNGNGSKNSNGNHRGKRSPTKNKFVKRLSNGDRVKRVLPDDDYETPAMINGDGGNGLEKKPTPESTIFRLTGGVELVPLLARRRRVGARTLPSSDVTRPPEQCCQYVFYSSKVTAITK